MSDGEDYVRVAGRIVEIRKAAVLFAVGETVPRGDWIPRSLIHGADDKDLDGKFAGQEATLRIFRWKAQQLGFLTTRDDRTADLFRGEP